MWWPFAKKKAAPVPTSSTGAFRNAGADRLQGFVERGFSQRHFFPHRVRYVPRPGSDGQVLAEAMYGAADPTKLRQVIIHAQGAALDSIPPELFFDRDIVWHQQHLGLPGHVAAANLIIDDRELLTTARYCDVVQRISRRRDLATRVEKRFRGWDHMLLNAVFGYAVEHDLRRIVLPGAAIALKHTDPKRDPKPALFDRIYDDDVQKRFRAKRRRGFWIVEVRDNLDRWVSLSREEESLDSSTSICICHDTERELGHLRADPEFARSAARLSERNLDGVLEAEARRGIRGTYAVVGRLMPELRGRIEHAGHEVAFHSWDHDLDRKQLARCREFDYRIPGYRPPNSRITSELNDRELARRNFEWLASSCGSIDAQVPQVRAGVARIPVHFDDFPLYKHGRPWAQWERDALGEIERRTVTTFGVHDCYAHLWLDHYEGFLEKLMDIGRVRTIGEVADEMFRRAAE